MRVIAGLLAGVLSAAVGAAQPFPPLSCNAEPAATPVVRAEGRTELVGDLLIVCTGGTPFAFGALLPTIDLRVRTVPDIPITSRDYPGGFSEALLFIDDPPPERQTICGSPAYPYSNPNGAVIEGRCLAHAGNGNGVGTYDPDTSSPAGMSRGNAWLGRRASSNALEWTGIPFDPPGPGGQRILRVVNVRVDASRLGSPTAPDQIGLLLQTGGAVTLSPVVVPVAGAKISLRIVAGNSFPFNAETIECLQCESANREFAEDPVRGFPSFGTCGSTAFTIRLIELQGSVLRPRTIAATFESLQPAVPSIAQDQLPSRQDAESGFFKLGNSDRWPKTLGPVQLAGPEDGAVGLADHGAEISIRFSNVPRGVQIWVPRSVSKNIVPCGLDRCDFGTLSMLDAPDAFARGDLVKVDSTVTYQVVRSRIPFATYRVSIPVTLAWVADPGNSSPAAGTATMHAHLGPVGGTTIPRFAERSTEQPVFTINACRTNILSPSSLASTASTPASPSRTPPNAPGLTLRAEVAPSTTTAPSAPPQST